MRLLGFLFFVFSSFVIQAQDMQLALLKYRGGGDWYANPTSLPNLARFCNEHLGTSFSDQIATVEPGDQVLFNHPFIHM
ncbi:MAG TPA: DUF4159 domain-containing protein, partial [Bacteroidales bacterium]|nr:DUF4159 domain-containing protein [Bacteroidales bacterium]